MPGRDNFEFSFSGVKTSVLAHVEKFGLPESDQSEAMADLCASFQEAVVDVLCQKTFRAALKHKVRDVVISGGVSANSRLRERAAEVAVSHGIRLSVPPLRLCTDNAAMIGGLGYHYLVGLAGRGFEASGLGASSSMPMGFGYLSDPRAPSPIFAPAPS
jgi:N6-L-threonylcarbamoyladenine synthase